ncbi:MAG: APC family permease [Firmicutes bacterium]|nr:APC family permease [Bacillota bacterium]
MSVHFARKATGLVRQAGAKDVFIYNVNFINIAIGVTFMVLFMPAGSYPGANLYWSTILVTLLALPTSLVYAMFASAMPRSGGEYVYISRVLSPLWGFAANWNYTIWSFFYIGVPAAFLGRYGISALARELGVLLHRPGLVQLGAWFTTPLGVAITGTILILLFAAVFVAGVQTYMRIQNLLFAIAMAGLVVSVALLFHHTPATAIAAFNRYAQPFTGFGDTYRHILTTLGSGQIHQAPMSWRNTLVAMTWPFTVLGFSIASAYIGGEIKGANRAQLVGMPGSLLYSAAWILVTVAAVFHAFGYRFLGNLGAVDPSAVHLGFTPTFSELSASLTHNLGWVLLLGVGYLLWTYAWLPIYLLTTTRNLLAWALDGLLPAQVAEVHDRWHAPVWAIWLSALLGIGFLWLYAYDPAFATIAGFFGQVAGTFLITSWAAIWFPYRQPEMFEASPVAWRVGRLPLISLLGALGVIGMSVIAWAFLQDPLSGISLQHPLMLLINAAVFVSGFLVFWVARAVRARQGIDLSLAYAEIPPE